MKKSLGLAALTLLVLGSAHAQQAASPLYGELGITAMRTTSGDGEKLKPTILRGILGYDVHPNIALEGMAGFSIYGDNFDFFGLDVKYEISRVVGAFVKPKFNITPELELFGRIGYAQTKEKVSIPGASASGSDKDMAYGAGINYKLTPRAYVGADFMSYYNKDGYKIDGLTIGLGYRF